MSSAVDSYRNISLLSPDDQWLFPAIPPASRFHILCFVKLVPTSWSSIRQDIVGLSLCLCFHTGSLGRLLLLEIGEGAVRFLCPGVSRAPWICSYHLLLLVKLPFWGGSQPSTVFDRRYRLPLALALAARAECWNFWMSNFGSGRGLPSDIILLL